MVGLVRGVHGLRGALRVEVLTDRPEVRFARGARLYREGTDAPLTIIDAVAVGDGPGWRLRFGEVPDRTAAEAFRGAYLEADIAPAETLPRGEYYWHELIGCPVRGSDGGELGTVADVYRVGENDVLVVRGGPLGEFDVPAVRDVVRIFAPRRGEIVVDADALGIGQVGSSRPSRARSSRARASRPRSSRASGS